MFTISHKNATAPNHIRPTRYPELGFVKIKTGLWRVVDTETGCGVGPQYASRSELLQDLARYAQEAYGLE